MAMGKIKLGFTALVMVPIIAAPLSALAEEANSCDISTIICAEGFVPNAQSCSCSPVPPCAEAAFHCLPGEHVDTVQCACVRDNPNCIKYVDAIVLDDDGGFSVKKLCLGEMPVDQPVQPVPSAPSCAEYVIQGFAGSDSAEAAVLQTLIDKAICQASDNERAASRIQKLETQVLKLVNKLRTLTKSSSTKNNVKAKSAGK